MDYREARHERRTLKQKLFTIRRHVEGEPVKLTKELEALKIKYEMLPGFTSWSGFPEKWDIGDPHGVKAVYINMQDASIGDVDRRNFSKLQGKTYEDIVVLETPQPAEWDEAAPETEDTPEIESGD